MNCVLFGSFKQNTMRIWVLETQSNMGTRTVAILGLQRLKPHIACKPPPACVYFSRCIPVQLTDFTFHITTTSTVQSTVCCKPSTAKINVMITKLRVIEELYFIAVLCKQWNRVRSVNSTRVIVIKFLHNKIIYCLIYYG